MTAAAFPPGACATRLRAAAASGCVTLAVHAALRRWPPYGAQRWQRHNYAERAVSLLEGPAVVAGLLASGAHGGRPVRRAGLLAVTGAALAGLYDDLYGSTHARGLHGHLRALRHGEVTTGIAKLMWIGATGCGAAALLDVSARPPDGSAVTPARLVDGVAAAALVAGAANLANLFDLRPGRTLKVALLLALPAACRHRPGAAVAAGIGGVAAAALPADLGETAMLGDCGANAIGALLGLLGAASSRRTRALSLAAVLVLTLASEAVSFSDVIAATPPLRRLDALGRRE